MASTSSFQSFELHLQSLIQWIAALPNDANEAQSKADLHTRVISLCARYISEYLQPCSTIDVDEDLIKQIVLLEDFADLKGAHKEAALRKHVKSVIKFYIAEKDIRKPFAITNMNQFGFQIEKLGLNVGMTSTNNSARVDGNLLVMAGMTTTLVLAFLGALIFKFPK